jgi:hypothetical protein
VSRRVKLLAASGHYYQGCFVTDVGKVGDMRHAQMSWLIMAMAVLFTGCGAEGSNTDRPATVPASGIVTYQGQPVDNAIVVFQPSASGSVAASALTNSEGEFDLKAFPTEAGAVPGSYTVAIMKISQEESSPEESSGSLVGKQKSLIPAKYGIAAQSGLVAEIPEDGTEGLYFELND